MNTKKIETKIKKLPDYIIPEVMDYIDNLLNKYSKTKNKKGKFKFDWEGGLSKLKSDYTSVELQHKSLNWR
ncbi:DUF2281 domain-containing protein [candidate division KSB1 bacterium]|nr:DUF2281 domain-containing protein [candidate division KSB1 bacterium]